MRGRWIFGYGSLIWRPNFPYVEKRMGYLRGWKRRFWQASPDHRGTEHQPGRVVTLLRASHEETCWGAAYCVAASAWESVIAQLNHRERAGYQLSRVTLHLADGGRQKQVFLYVAGPENPNYVGPAPLRQIAAHARRCHGPSGSNREYVLELDHALRRAGCYDPHVAALAKLMLK